jgi:hypothetical protein
MPQELFPLAVVDVCHIRDLWPDVPEQQIHLLIVLPESSHAFLSNFLLL